MDACVGMGWNEKDEGDASLLVRALGGAFLFGGRGVWGGSEWGAFVSGRDDSMGVEGEGL